MPELDPSRVVATDVVYTDEDLIELEAVVGAAPWRGQARAYTVTDDVAAFAAALTRFVDGGPPAGFVAGRDDGIGMIALRFYRIDRAGHIAGHARLASRGSASRPEEVARLDVEFGAEAWALGQFARQLAELARTESGRAVLAVEPPAP